MSTVLIYDDFDDTNRQESYKELQKFKEEVLDTQKSAKRRKFLKDLILGFLSFSLLANNFIQCAVLTPVTQDDNKLSPEATIFYISKDLALLIASPFVGVVIDHMGSDTPFLCGSVVMFLSTALLACGKKPLFFLFARIFHGFAAACIETSAMSTIANIFTTTIARTKGFGILLEIASFGFYSETSMLIDFLLASLDQTLFLILAFIPFVNGVILFLVSSRLKMEEAKEFQITKPTPIPIWKLFIDPYIILCSGALMVANIPLVFFLRAMKLYETNEFLQVDGFKADTAWFLLFAHLLGITFVILVTAKYSSYRWLMALVGLTLEGVSCFTVPFVDTCEALEIVACGIAFGCGMVRATILPTLACIMEIRHGPVFGSVYAIANAFFSVGFVVSPLVAYLNLQSIGCITIVVTMGLLNTLYAPVLFYLRRF